MPRKSPTSDSVDAGSINPVEAVELAIAAEQGNLASAVGTGTRARGNNNASVRLGFLGQLEEALAHSEAAVALQRQLKTDAPDVSASELAAFLKNLSNCLGALGRWEEALAAIGEAIAIDRQAAVARPDASVHLVGGLTNLSAILCALGRPEEALAACEEAVALLPEPPVGQLDTFLPVSAVLLNNLAVSLLALAQFSS